MDDVVEEVVGVAGRDLALLRPRDVEALLSEDDFAHDEFLPYWAELWPSSLALARAIGTRALRGARTLELGCGLGLPSLAAALAGGKVLATDWARDAVELTARNAQRNQLELATRQVSWTEPGPLLEHAPWDLVLASDVLYEERNADALLPLLPRLVDQRGEIWLADPGRPFTGAFLEQASRRFTIDTRPAQELPQGGVHRMRLKGSSP